MDIFFGTRQENLFCAFALARVAAAMRVDHLERALGLFDLARRKVQENGGNRGGNDGELVGKWWENGGKMIGR